MISPDRYPIVRHAELVREAELDAEHHRHPDQLVRRRPRRFLPRRPR